MSKQDQEAEVISDLFHDAFHNHKELGKDIAHTLHQAGLLVEDLPEPKHAADGAMVWSDGEVWIEDDEVAVYTDLPKSTSWMTPNEARNLAHALLAAANHAEEE